MIFENIRRWLHKTRGTLYIEVARGILQSKRPGLDNLPVVVYRDGKRQMWVREVSEFEDGRFEPKSEPVDSRLFLLLQMIGTADGSIDATDHRHNMLNFFCDDRGEGKDTFNLAIEQGFVRVEHNSDFDTSNAFLTDKGWKTLQEFLL